MKKTIIYIIIFAIIGLIIGYLFFGKVAGDYISIKAIFSSADNPFETLGRNISGLSKMKQNILICGGVGAVLGGIISLARRK